MKTQSTVWMTPADLQKIRASHEFGDVDLNQIDLTRPDCVPVRLTESEEAVIRLRSDLVIIPDGANMEMTIRFASIEDAVRARALLKEDSTICIGSDYEPPSFQDVKIVEPSVAPIRHEQVWDLLRDAINSETWRGSPTDFATDLLPHVIRIVEKTARRS